MLVSFFYLKGLGIRTRNFRYLPKDVKYLWSSQAFKHITHENIYSIE